MNPITKSYLDYTRGVTKYSPWILLRPLGWLGGVVVRYRKAFYDHGIFSSEESPISVVSVGNLTTGGTNKTPFVEFLTQRLLDAGLRPGVISRGYGGKASNPVLLIDGNADRSVVGDEPLLLSAHLHGVPLAVSSDRMADIRSLLPYNVEIIVADDAFQHRRMGRDLDIVLVDATCPFGNGTPLPSGILRENPSALTRAHIVIISKSNQISSEALAHLHEQISQWVPSERIFYSHIGPPHWHRWNGCELTDIAAEKLEQNVLIFSGIGNPRSFGNTVVQGGAKVIREIEFKDHHQYTAADLTAIFKVARELGVDSVCCTEKDIFNLPSNCTPAMPLYVPRIRTILDDEKRFWKIFTETLRPSLVVASNGFGEDAIGARLALKVRSAFPCASVSAFPLVGQGEAYKNDGTAIDAPLAASPTGGIIKYHFKDLIREVRAGLFTHIGNQFGQWENIRSGCRTVLCVGDVYLLCHTLWGQGKRALMVATAKTQFISGHWRLESFLLRHCCKKVWTRDEATAEDLRRRGVNAVFEGNPIMDLLCDNVSEARDYWGVGRRILVLPGSRSRAYQDVKMLLSALDLLSSRCQITAVMVVALTLNLKKLVESADGWVLNGDVMTRDNLSVKIFHGDVSIVARSAELLLGMAGTANQVCAGMGVPVLSVQEKGKCVQKKLLGDAELLVEATPEALAQAAYDLLNDPDRLMKMGEVGRERLGKAGALDSVVEYAAEQFGWRRKCALYEKLSHIEF